MRRTALSLISLGATSLFLMAPSCLDDLESKDEGYCCCYTTVQETDCGSGATTVSTDECSLLDSASQCASWTEDWSSEHDGCTVNTTYTGVGDGGDACGSTDNY